MVADEAMADSGRLGRNNTAAYGFSGELGS